MVWLHTCDCIARDTSIVQIQEESPFNEFYRELDRTGVAMKTVLSRYGVTKPEDLSPELLGKALNSLRRTKTKSA